MTVQIAVKIFGFGIFDSLLQHHTFRILCCHINADIRRNTIFLIGQPLDRTRIYKRGNSYRHPIVIKLGIIIRHLKLGNDIYQAAHLTIAQQRCGVLIQKRYRPIIHFLNVICKIPVFQRQQLLVFLCIYDG